MTKTVKIDQLVSKNSTRKIVNIDKYKDNCENIISSICEVMDHIYA